MKISIKNRKGQNIVVLLELNDKQKGLAFVMHGLSGYKEQNHIQVFSEAFFENGYTVVRFDTTNTFGESDGKYEDATITNYYEDLEDVISWSKEQKWYQEPFILAGHSLGGICTALYAEKFPESVKALAPISTTVSGKLSLKQRAKEEIENWKKTGWQSRKSTTRPDLITKLPWSHMEDKLKYDLIPEIEKLTMPVIIIVGDNDKAMEANKYLYNNLIGEKEMYIIKDAPHTFVDKNHLDEIKKILKGWVKKIS